MDSIDHWKRIVYIVSAVVIGTGISIIGVISFIPLFLTSELGVEDPGEAAFWGRAHFRRDAFLRVHGGAVLDAEGR